VKTPHYVLDAANQWLLQLPSVLLTLPPLYPTPVSRRERGKETGREKSALKGSGAFLHTKDIDTALGLQTTDITKICALSDLLKHAHVAHAETLTRLFFSRARKITGASSFFMQSNRYTATRELALCVCSVLCLLLLGTFVLVGACSITIPTDLCSLVRQYSNWPDGTAVNPRGRHQPQHGPSGLMQYLPNILYGWTNTTCFSVGSLSRKAKPVAPTDRLPS
jgi:hypothetical protein